MNSRIMGIGFAMAFAVTAPGGLDAQPHELQGSWNLEFPAPWGVVVWTFELQHDGEGLAGTSVQGMGTLMLEGTLRGHDIEFIVDLKDGPHALTMGFVGAVGEDGIRGTVEFDDGSSAEWTLAPVRRGSPR